MHSIERRDLLRPGVLQPCGEVDLPKVDVEGPAPDGQPADVAEGLAAGEGQDQILTTVGLERDKP